MTCIKCSKEFTEDEGYINCDICGDFCSEGCFNTYHDEHPHTKE